MAYATKADIEKAVGADALLSFADFDNDGTLGASDLEAIDDALDDASSFADTYLTAHLPISTVPNALRRAVVDIACNYLRGGDKTTEDSRRAYDAAVAWLRDVSKGNASLGLAAAVSEDEVDAGDPELVAGDRIWTRKTARGIF